MGWYVISEKLSQVKSMYVSSPNQQLAADCLSPSGRRPRRAGLGAEPQYTNGVEHGGGRTKIWPC